MRSNQLHQCVNFWTLNAKFFLAISSFGLLLPSTNTANNLLIESLNNEPLLIAAMQGGDEKAFTLLYRHYSPQIYMNLLGIVRDPLIAEEMVQELFTRIWQKRESNGIAENFCGYMYRIGQHLVHDFFRRIKHDHQLRDRFRLLASQYYEPIEENLDHLQLSGILNQAVEQLPKQQKRVYELVRLEGLTYKKAAEIMGISPFTVKEYLVNSNKTIRHYVLSHAGGDALKLFLLLYVSFSR